MTNYMRQSLAWSIVLLSTRACLSTTPNLVPAIFSRASDAFANLPPLMHARESGGAAVLHHLDARLMHVIERFAKPTRMRGKYCSGVKMLNVCACAPARVYAHAACVMRCANAATQSFRYVGEDVLATVRAHYLERLCSL